MTFRYQYEMQSNKLLEDIHYQKPLEMFQYHKCLNTLPVVRYQDYCSTADAQTRNLGTTANAQIQNR